MSSASQILDVAERHMRREGYQAVSYRDIAAEVGIKSASLHYHFPKKEDLGAALVRRYTQNFQDTLGETAPDSDTPAAQILAFIEIYRQALTQQKVVCLCAVLGAEAPGLPPRVSQEVRAFFTQNIDWLTQRYKEAGEAKPAARAKTTLALLEGAMILASVNEDMSIFEAAADAAKV